jgi:hypothetical protein
LQREPLRCESWFGRSLTEDREGMNKFLMKNLWFIHHGAIIAITDHYLSYLLLSRSRHTLPDSHIDLLSPSLSGGLAMIMTELSDPLDGLRENLAGWTSDQTEIILHSKALTRQDEHILFE